VTGDRGDDPYVRRWGSQDGRALLFLHALGPASSAAFVGLGVQSLVEAGYAVAAPDLPGYGRSAPVQPEEYAVPALAARMADLADDLGWARYVLVGHSWGGAIACHLAAQHPDLVQALVLVDSGHLDYADTPGADLASSLGDLMARGEERRLHLADRAAVAELLDVPEEDPLVDAFLEGMEGDPDGGLVSHPWLGQWTGALPPGSVPAERDVARDRPTPHPHLAPARHESGGGSHGERGRCGRLLGCRPAGRGPVGHRRDALVGHRRA